MSELKISLLEYDDRFAVFKEFVPYDFENPMRLPGTNCCRLEGNPFTDFDQRK